MAHIRSITPTPGVVRMAPVTCTTPPIPYAYAQQMQVQTPMAPITYAAPPAPYVAPPAIGRRRREVGRIGRGGPHYSAVKTRDLDIMGASRPKGHTRMIITALDYNGTSNPLTCTVDGDNMLALAKACGVQDVVQLYDAECTKWKIEQEMIRIGQTCAHNPNDVFVFCYAGHGTSVTDYDGDEIDQKDEAYVLCDQLGQAIPPSNDSLMTDDEFCRMVTTHIPDHTTTIVISDCCHSGTICDFKKHAWDGRKALSISGCRDTQTSGDTGHGGICTHAMLMAIENLQKKGKRNYKVFDLFAETLRVDDDVFDSPQDITVNCDSDHRPKDFDWPLIPLGPYAAPYRGHGSRAANGAGAHVSQAPAAAHHPAHHPAHTTAAMMTGIAGAGYPDSLATAGVPYGQVGSQALLAAPAGATTSPFTWTQILDPGFSVPSPTPFGSTTYTTSGLPQLYAAPAAGQSWRYY